MEPGSTDSAPTTKYLFLDEGGNFDFSSAASAYFTLTSVAMARPFALDAPLADLRFDLIERGLALERFHASDDRQPVRDEVFRIVCQSLHRLQVDCVVARKSAVPEASRSDERFYPELMGQLLRHLLGGLPDSVKQVVVITD